MASQAEDVYYLVCIYSNKKLKGGGNGSQKTGNGLKRNYTAMRLLKFWKCEIVCVNYKCEVGKVRCHV